MNKYVIELRPDCKVVQQICESDGRVSIGSQSIVYLEELNADYVNEHFGVLQDDAYNAGLERGKKEAYQKGFEDGKWKSEDGCTGCKYEGKVVTGQPCISCCNSYKNQWTAKKQDDEIKVGDEVVWTEDEDTVIIVTLIYTSSGIEWCDGICRDGKVYQIITEHARKTGRHFDIESILEDMRE